jgi:hypothetical protein|tara:strand:- start:1516 stop:1974 length:459 start_codon:yes stop_codon:yes gene_type:complete
MIIKKDIVRELIEPLFDLDGTLIIEDRDSTWLFDFNNDSAILNLVESDLTPLGVLVRDSGKLFDILTARGESNAPFIRIALENLGFNIRKIICVGIDINEPSDMDKVSAEQVVINKQKIVRSFLRKLVDNDPRNLEGLGELGELVTQDQKEF